MKKYKIGWQKYEDVIEQQMSSPAIKKIMKNMLMENDNFSDKEEEFLDEESDIDFDEDKEDSQDLLLVPMSQKVLDELTIANSFDCWIGHTNFDITFKIKDRLNTIQGVEILKIFSRYRFFIGIGKMFDFKEVRANIEKEIIPRE